MIYSRLLGALFLALFVAYGYAAQDIQLDFWATEELFNARTFPTMIAVGGSLLSLLFIAFAPMIQPPTATGNLHQLLQLIGLMLAYAWAMSELGFLLATSLFLGLAFIVLGERRPVRVTGLAVAIGAGFYTLMWLLDIQLPAGILGDLL